MEWFVRAFVRASLVWFGLGVTLGLGMVVHPPWTAYRPAHFHMNLLGFVAMMIFGVAYHVIPRFAGRPLRAPALARAHWWISNAGLALLTAGFVIRVHRAAAGTTMLAAGAVLAAGGAYCFIYNIWRTLGGAVTAAVVAPGRGGPPGEAPARAPVARR